MSVTEEIREANRYGDLREKARREEAEALLEEIERSRDAVRSVVRAELDRLAALSPALIDRTELRSRRELEMPEAIEGHAECADQGFLDCLVREEIKRIQEEAGQ